MYFLVIHYQFILQNPTRFIIWIIELCTSGNIFPLLGVSLNHLLFRWCCFLDLSYADLDLHQWIQVVVLSLLIFRLHMRLETTLNVYQWLLVQKPNIPDRTTNTKIYKTYCYLTMHRIFSGNRLGAHISRHFGFFPRDIFRIMHWNFFYNIKCLRIQNHSITNLQFATSILLLTNQKSHHTSNLYATSPCGILCFLLHPNIVIDSPYTVDHQAVFLPFLVGFLALGFDSRGNTFFVRHDIKCPNRKTISQRNFLYNQIGIISCRK